jgi:hypothetical protein
VRKVAFALFLVLLAACREPLSTEQFVRGAGPYVFSVDMSDTTAAYDFDLYTRLEGTHTEMITLQPSALLRAEWRSPSDSVLVEKVYLPLQGEHETYYTRDIYEPYRANVRPVEPGVWTLTLRPEDRAQVLPLRGMGLVVKKHRD